MPDPLLVDQGAARGEPDLLLIDLDLTAKLLSMSRRTIVEMVGTGEIPSVKIRGRRLVSLERLREWVRDRTRGGEG